MGAPANGVSSSGRRRRLGSFHGGLSEKISGISEKDLAGSGVTYTVSAPFDERPPGKRRRVTREDFRQFLSRRFLRSEFGRIFEKDLAKRGETHRVSPPFE